MAEKVPPEGFWRTLRRRSERGGTLEAVALLDIDLADALRSRLAGDGRTLDQMFKGEGMFAGFGSRVRLGYVLGLYGEATYKDLITISKIRNEFAHEADASSFDQGRIKDLAANLRVMDRFVQLLGEDAFERMYGEALRGAGLGDRKRFQPAEAFDVSVAVLRLLLRLFAEDGSPPRPPRF